MRIAIVDDDETGAGLFSIECDRAGIASKRYVDAESFLREYSPEAFDAVLVDWNLPHMDGIALIRHLRIQLKSQVPIIVVTVRDSEPDVVEALEAGADAFVSKPARIDGLIARLRAITRRAASSSAIPDVLEWGRLRFDIPSRQVSNRGQPVKLTQKEFSLALYMLSNVGVQLSRKTIMEAVWGRDAAWETRTLDSHIARIRTKLQLRPEFGYLLEPIYHLGYRLERLSED